MADIGISYNILSLIAGLFVLGVFYLVYGIFVDDWGLQRLVGGADKRASSSKLQWTIWTVVVLYSFITIYSFRILNGHWEPIQDIPQNVLIAMGLSTTTMVAAKAITTGYVANGLVDKDQGKTTVRNDSGVFSKGFWSNIFNDDGGTNPDLSKVQMMAWTFVAVGVYLLNVLNIVYNTIDVNQFGNVVVLPDISASLMVLMGLGEGAYIGKKLVTKDTPRITGLSPGSGKIADQLTLTGMAFGSREGNLITVDGTPINAEIANADWKDTEIKFKLPQKKPNGKDWEPGKSVTIGLIINGRTSENNMPFTIEA